MTDSFTRLCQELPECSGVYIVKQGANVLYVGQARNLRRRWIQHHRTNQLRQLGADSLSWIPVDPSALIETEARLIGELQPSLNGRMLPGWATHPIKEVLARRWPPMSVAQLARRLDLNEGVMSQYLRGLIAPIEGFYLAAAVVLECEADELRPHGLTAA